jgi:hypothetical protein
MNNGYVIKPSSNDIQHHGILGQKWGKQNGPPYPLGSEDHSSAEKKAGWKKSLNTKKLQNEDGSLTKKGKKKFSKLIKIDEEREEILKKRNEAIDKEINYYNKNRKKNRNDESYKEDIREFYISDPGFKDIEDSVIKYEKALTEVNKKYVKEYMNVSNKKYGLFTIIGDDRTSKIIEDYNKYKDNVKK